MVLTSEDARDRRLFTKLGDYDMTVEVKTPITIRYGETDMMGVVYHANYLLYMDQARCDFVEKVVMPYSEIEAAGYVSPIRAIDITYYKPLVYSDKPYVLTTVSSMRATKVVYHQRVFHEGQDPAVDQPHVEAYVTSCIVERESLKPISIKRIFPDLYEKYVAAAEPC